MNVFIFSHIADCDGITPVILSKLAFKNVDYLLLDNPIDNEFLNYVNTHDFKKYDYIFMTDICVSDDTISKLDKEFLDKFMIFDHHITNIDMNKYSFINVTDNIKKCATSLYYDYLIKNLEKNVTKEICDIVRLSDTWSWEKEGKAPNSSLTDYLSIMGIDSYIDYFYNFILNNDEFYLEEKLAYLFKVEEKRKQDYINLKDTQLIKVYIKPYKVGVVFAESYRSLLGNTLAKRHIDLDFIIIINISRSISYRGVTDIDLSKFASIYGGKGHFHASGSPLPKDIHKNIINLIFKEASYEE